ESVEHSSNWPDSRKLCSEAFLFSRLRCAALGDDASRHLPNRASAVIQLAHAAGVPHAAVKVAPPALAATFPGQRNPPLCNFTDPRAGTHCKSILSSLPNSRTSVFSANRRDRRRLTDCGTLLSRCCGPNNTLRRRSGKRQAERVE